MVDFRKGMLFLGLLAGAGLASGQTFNPLSCVANSGVVPIARAEGVAEEVGQIVIVCNGGTPTAQGTAIPTVNVQVFLNTNVTSRILSGTNASEALLLIDEPGSPQNAVPQLINPAGSTPTITSANGNGQGNYVGTDGRYNIFQGIQAATNSIAWLGVPIDPPGTAGNRVIRLTNIRANASQLGVSSTLVPSSISESITITGTGSLSLSNATLTVAFVQPGLKFTSNAPIYNQCEPATDSLVLSFSELFGTAFRIKGAANQSVPGTIYNTESMFTPAPTAGTTLPAAGLATQGTRLIASFSNVPANVTISVPYQNDSVTVGYTAQLVTGTDAAGNGGTITTGTGSAPVTITGGTGIAVWEVTDATAGQIQAYSFTSAIGYESDPLPGLGTATVAGNYAPTTTVFTASTTAPVPRFISNPQSVSSFIINSCQTNLLFPFVTNVGGFDTGIAVSNTSLDPFGTVGQTGTVTIYYYGASAPDAQTTTSTVAPGSQVVFTLSGGGTAGITGAPGFQGYAIAHCNFQYGHGYAFISDVGATKLAQGYVALVLDADKFDPNALAENSRTGAKSEPLKQ